ncbi:MAG: PAS domain-containing protein [Burkholderiales bacterium]|nr:PAS domain-containing protein [Burkholderiales bacterium]
MSTDHDWSSLFEFLPIGAYRNAPDGHQWRANPALVRLNAFATEAEHLAADAQPNNPWYVDPERRAQFRALLARDGVVTGFESEVRRYATGERIWVRENAHAVRDASGAVLFYEGTIEDITPQVNAREALRRSAGEMQQIVDLVPGMVYRVLLLPDGGRRATFVSSGVRALLGLEPDDFLRDGLLMHKLRHPEDRARIEALTAARNATGAATEMEHRVLLPDGRVKWLHVLSAAAPAEQGLPVRVGMVFDITARKQAEQALRASEARMQQLLSLLPGVVYYLYVEPDGRRRYGFVSDYVRTLYGIEPAAVLADGDALLRMRHPEVAASTEAIALPGMLRGEDLHYETRIVAADGSERWVEVHSRPAPPEDASGTQVRVGVLLDITQRKRAELALQAQAEVWKRAIEASGDGVWDWNLAEGTGLLSPQCKALYGFAPDELPDTPGAIDARTHPDDKAAMLAAREAHFSGRAERYINEHRVLCKDGSWKWILTRGLVISRDAEGRPLRVVGTHTDITPAKQAEALRVERDRAAAADLAKSQFLSRVSHELRTPLNAILGFAQLLELDPGGMPERQRAWVQQVSTSGRHLLELIDDVLDLSSAQTGQLAVQQEPVPLRPVVEKAWRMLAHHAEARGITLQDEIDDRSALLADGKRLTQVVSNLLSNAIKYNRSGGWVRVGARQVDGMTEFSVADSGPGLSALQQARLFNPFDRLGAERSAVPGTGLGLALTRQLLDAMGGSITVRSAPGEGSVFSVRLPRA